MVLNIVYDFSHIHTVEVAGSNPAPPTSKIKGLHAIKAVNPFLIVAHGGKSV